jgi:hypothetical protein
LRFNFYVSYLIINIKSLRDFSQKSVSIFMLIIRKLISFIRSEKQIKVKGIVTGLGVKTPIDG